MTGFAFVAQKPSLAGVLGSVTTAVLVGVACWETILRVRTGTADPAAAWRMSG